MRAKKIAMRLVMPFMAANLLWGEVQAAEVKIVYDLKGYELVDQESAKLESVLAEVRSDAAMNIEITEQTANLNTISPAYLRQKIRSLKVFQFLVRKGIDPARISTKSIPSSSAEILVKTVSGTEMRTAPVARQEVSKESKEQREFTLQFPSSSAEPTSLSSSDFAAFLASVGQSGHDALVIEGYADVTGNAGFNQALSELRALRAFELLVRQGLSPVRIDTKGLGTAGAAANAKDDSAKQAARRVVLRWTTDEKVAAIAAAEEKKEEPAPKVEPAPVEKKEELVVEEKKPEPVVEQPAAPAVAPEKSHSEGFSIDVVPFAGLLIPSGKLADRAKKAGNFGLGIGTAFWSTDASELRLTGFFSAQSKLEAKQTDRSGSLNINFINLRTDYVFGGSTFRPFLGAGLGMYVWQAKITQDSSGSNNSDSKRDLGWLLATGVDIRVMDSVFVAPEFTLHRVGGDFSETLMSVWASLRWRI